MQLFQCQCDFIRHCSGVHLESFEPGGRGSSVLASMLVCVVSCNRVHWKLPGNGNRAVSTNLYFREKNFRIFMMRKFRLAEPAHPEGWECKIFLGSTCSAACIQLIVGTCCSNREACMFWLEFSTWISCRENWKLETSLERFLCGK